MNNMMEAFKVLAPNKDLESFKIGYYCRQEHIDILEEENFKLKEEKKSYQHKKETIESLERLFNALIKHEHSECGTCLYCESQWSLINTISEKLEELKG